MTNAPDFADDQLLKIMTLGGLPAMRAKYLARAPKSRDGASLSHG
jgi:hypothetical protein